MAEMIPIILILVLMIIAFVGSLYVRAFLTRRALFKVVEVFYQHKALGNDSAKTPLQLGLERPDLFQRMTRPRNYKQNALQILKQRGIILEKEDGSLYMVEEKLDEDLRSKRRQTVGY